jgi:hypothetical protein
MKISIIKPFGCFNSIESRSRPQQVFIWMHRLCMRRRTRPSIKLNSDVTINLPLRWPQKCIVAKMNIALRLYGLRIVCFHPSSKTILFCTLSCLVLWTEKKKMPFFIHFHIHTNYLAQIKYL